MSSTETPIPEIYKKFGSAANNTTIPKAEKERIYADKEGDAGAIRRGEMALAGFCEEHGLKPPGDWMDWIGVDYSKLGVIDRCKLPLAQQRLLQRSGVPLSKSPHNLKSYLDRKRK